MKRWLLPALLLVAAGAGAYILYTPQGDPRSEASATPQRPEPGIPVGVAIAEQKPMPVQIETIGRVQTISSVAVKSRMDGMIAAVPVSDGQEVKAGTVLFRLDDRQAQAQLHQAQANLVRDKAQLENSHRDLDRLTPLQQKEFVSRQAYDQARTNVAMQEAAVKSDEALIENMQVALSYTVITAPIDGRLGTINYKVGSNVKANDTAALVTINQIKPIYVSFSVSQGDLAELREAVNHGQVAVKVLRQGGNFAPIEGRVAYFENAVDAASNTINVRATVDNTDSALWPGQFVNVVVTLRTEPNAVVVPSQAVQAGQEGPYLYAIGKDGKAELRHVSIARTIGGEIVIAKGVAPGEEVVTSGQLRISNGAKLAPRSTAAPDNKTAETPKPKA